MTTQISTKLAALAVALVMNSMIIGGVAFLFNSQMHPHTMLVSVTHGAQETSHSAV